MNLGKLAQKGAKPWNKGVLRTAQEKKNISEGRKNYYKTHEHPRGMLGKKHSEASENI